MKALRSKAEEKRKKSRTSVPSSPPISRRDKLRNVATLCCSFARNMSYYRAGWDEKHAHLLRDTGNNFWRQVNANFLDMCVLEWCKLFADKREKHHWNKIVTHPEEFKASLLQSLGVDELAFQDQIRIMRTYRDKWVAHLDYDRSGFYPTLSRAKHAIWFYYTWVAGREAHIGDLDGFPLPEQLDEGYRREEEAAKAVYEAACSGASSVGALIR